LKPWCIMADQGNPAIMTEQPNETSSGSRRGVIFDMDGVLIDSYRAHFESWRKMALDSGLGDISEEQFAATFGRTSRDIISALWPDMVGPEDIPALDAMKEACFRQIIASDFPEMDGASDLIAALHAAGFVMGIGSSGPPENVRAVLDCLPNAACISAVVNGMDVTVGKPHPDVFLTAATKLGLPPARCAVVEDAPAGIEAALRAGMTAIALTGTAPADKLAKAHLVVASLRELMPGQIAQLIDSRASNLGA